MKTSAVGFFFTVAGVIVLMDTVTHGWLVCSFLRDTLSLGGNLRMTMKAQGYFFPLHWVLLINPSEHLQWMFSVLMIMPPSLS